MRYMGGLRKHMRWTYAVFLIGSLSLAGIFPLAGFWSKDEILASALGHGGVVPQLVFWMGMIAVFMTAFYMFRVVFMVFEGPYKGGASADPNAHAHAPSTRPHESPPSMVWPMAILAVFAVFAGFVAKPIFDLGPIPEHWLVHDFLHAEAEGIQHCGRGRVDPDSRRRDCTGVPHVLPPADTARTGRLYIPPSLRVVLAEILSRRSIRKSHHNSRLLPSRCTIPRLDRPVGDRRRGSVGRQSWTEHREENRPQLQTGQVQGYGMVVSLGVLAVIGAYLLFR